jgi:hypothetical protein
VWIQQLYPGSTLQIVQGDDRDDSSEDEEDDTRESFQDDPPPENKPAAASREADDDEAVEPPKKKPKKKTRRRKLPNLPARSRCSQIAVRKLLQLNHLLEQTMQKLLAIKS